MDERKVAILAAAHAFTEEMEKLGVKFATVVYDEAVQQDDGMRIYTVGNIPQPLIDWLLKTYVQMREKSEVIEVMHIQRPAVGTSPS